MPELPPPAPEWRLDAYIALLVAITATFMAFCNVKDGNIVQGMAQAQAGALDAWSYYQAKSTKQSLAEATLDQITLQRELSTAAPDVKAKLDAKVAEYAARVKRYEKEKAEIKTQAEGYQKTYDALNVHDDQFDLSEAALSVAIALFGVTALVKKKALFVVACVFMLFGVVMGLAGFLGWGLHPDALIKFLT